MTKFAFCRALLSLWSLALASLGTVGLPAAQAETVARTPFYLTPEVEGTRLCPEAAQQPPMALDAAYAWCAERGLDGAQALAALLDRLEPGGPRGQVQVGYTAAVRLLGLYKRAETGWVIDEARADAFLRLITRVQRPVVVYFTADHFDSQGSIVDTLVQEPANLMQLSDGKPLQLDYFGFRVVPYTLLTDASIPVNRLRYTALEYMARRILALPPEVQQRIVAFTLAGELHQMFPDFSGGMGAYQNILVTDYSPASVAGFRAWLHRRHGSIAAFNRMAGTQHTRFEDVAAPSRDVRRDRRTPLAEHYDAFADGTLPFSGWLWDAQRQIQSLDLYIDGQRVGPVARGLNRLDVYRAVESIDDPNVGYRIDYDYSALPPGRHVAQIVGTAQGVRYRVAETTFQVLPRNPSPLNLLRRTRMVEGLQDLKALPGVRTWLDLPQAEQSVLYNPVALEWNRYRSAQVHDFLAEFHRRSVRAGLPPDKLYAHQIVPEVNSTWNPQLFAVDATLQKGLPWKTGLNMYGGAAHSDWLRRWMAERAMHDYGVPEFNPQQWKRPGLHLQALRAHQRAGARFVSPYYFSVIPDHYKGGEHGVNRMELRPDNASDGSNQLYQAIVEMARE